MGVRKQRARRSLTAETLETRVLLAADIQIDAATEIAHGAGCACGACACVSQEVAAALPESDLLREEHDHGELQFSADGKAFYFDPAPELGDPGGRR